MEKLIAELKQMVRFKDSTDIGDLVLIVAKEPQISALYALVTDIERDSSRKNEWWHVSLTLLSIPPQETIWTLRTPQLTGMEVFTMGGEERFVKAVEFGTISLQPAAIDGLTRAPKTTQEQSGPLPQEEKKRSFLKRVK
ncbi:MAG: hypothetical protein KKB91_05250 [Proteobacteria bacterium]|jgi:hypothetical protein|nr:hypothetical protein [Pseudomonadota bacterium]MCG2742944.1 hypothetical protein [Desulfobacteraceae bacterium]MDO8945701.1 hypothetical protein [Desulfocapsaceae bacterium]MBU3984115.1 hypothetical protein [Pseudomonadota bacterium]MBU4027906.1 hypothetical protein [Pseudomonadota bacterium]